MEKTTQSITKRCKLVVVDNTNVEYWEMKKYFKLANCHGYRVIIVEPMTYVSTMHENDKFTEPLRSPLTC